MSSVLVLYKLLKDFLENNSANNKVHRTFKESFERDCIFQAPTVQRVHLFNTSCQLL